VRDIAAEKNYEEVYQFYSYYEAIYDANERVVVFKEYKRGDVIREDRYRYGSDGSLVERSVALPGKPVEVIPVGAPVHGDAGGVQVVVESCLTKWKKLFAADKYLFRAVVSIDPDVQIRVIDIRDSEDGDMDRVRLPEPRARGDGKPGSEYEIYDSFKMWGSHAELVVEDSEGREYVRAFVCKH
jgi:hypothetical protein